MRNTAFSIVTVAVLLAGSSASADVMGTLTDLTFTEPSPACVAPVVCAGIGTNTFEFGTAGSVLQATAVSFDGPRETKLVVAHLLFSNMENDIGSSVSGISLTFNTGNVIATGADTPLFDSVYDFQSLTYLFEIVNTPNTTDPLASADIVRFRDKSQLFQIGDDIFDQFHVLEGGSTTVEILGTFGSFGLVGFGQVLDPGQGFVSSSVPEPSTIALLGVGFIAMVLARSKRRSRGSSRYSSPATSQARSA